MTKKLPAVEDLATAFAFVLMSWLEPPEWREMCQLNRTEMRAGICHSHDFCDANMAMHEAFGNFDIDPLEFRYDPDLGMDPEVNRLWDAAWDYAKFYYLS